MSVQRSMPTVRNISKHNFATEYNYRVLNWYSFKTRNNQHKSSLKPKKSTKTIQIILISYRLSCIKLHAINPFEPEVCTICNLKRIVITESNKERSFESANRAHCLVLPLQIVLFLFNLTIFYLLIVYVFEIAFLI